MLAHRIASSYRAEGRDADAYQLATSVTDPNALQNVPQLMWDAGFAAYRLGDWVNATAWLERLAETAMRRTACGRKALSGRRAPICNRAIRRKW